MTNPFTGLTIYCSCKLDECECRPEFRDLPIGSHFRLPYDSGSYVKTSMSFDEHNARETTAGNYIQVMDVQVLQPSSVRAKNDLSGFAAREAGDPIPERIATGTRIKCNCGFGQAYVHTVGRRNDMLECVNCGRWILDEDGGYLTMEKASTGPPRVEPTPERIAEAMEGGGEVWVDAEENRKAFAQRVLEVFQRVRPESTMARQDAFGDIVIRVGAGQNVAVCEYAGEQVGMNYWGQWYSEIPFDDIEEDLNEVLPRLAAKARIAEDSPQISAEEVRDSATAKVRTKKFEDFAWQISAQNTVVGLVNISVDITRKEDALMLGEMGELLAMIDAKLRLAPKTDEVREVESGYAKPTPPPPWVTEYSFVKAKPIPSEDVIGIICDSRPRTTADDIADVCDGIRDMLLEKNRKYGNSALEPVRIFSRASAVEQILVRLDDKLSRLRSAQSDEDEDVVDDLIGYLVLLKIARSR